MPTRQGKIDPRTIFRKTGEKNMGKNILNWMRNNESKFAERSKNSMSKAMKSRSLDASSIRDSKNIVKEGQKDKGTLDAFLNSQTSPKNSKLFDDYFGVADFRLLTKKALQSNSVKN